jgi:hypothetical protein
MRPNQVELARTRVRAGRAGLGIAELESALRPYRDQVLINLQSMVARRCRLPPRCLRVCSVVVLSPRAQAQRLHVQRRIREVEETMRVNIAVVERSEQLEDLEEKAESLAADSSVFFSKQAKSKKKKKSEERTRRSVREEAARPVPVPSAAAAPAAAPARAARLPPTLSDSPAVFVSASAPAPAAARAAVPAAPPAPMDQEQSVPMSVALEALEIDRDGLPARVGGRAWCAIVCTRAAHARRTTWTRVSWSSPRRKSTKAAACSAASRQCRGN